LLVDEETLVKFMKYLNSRNSSYKKQIEEYLAHNSQDYKVVLKNLVALSQVRLSDLEKYIHHRKHLVFIQAMFNDQV